MFGRRRPKRKLDGVWHALWQTVDGQPNFNSELLEAHWVRGAVLVVSNDEPSSENPEGGYLWRSELQFHDNCYLLGSYFPDDPTIASKGTMFGLLHPTGRYVRGIWVGCNYDEQLTSGRFVFSRDKDRLWKLLALDLGIDVQDIKRNRVK
ncbi:MAG: hypothetical protein ACREP9_01745 [Candidatus Dormibacteraceae bacterium]